MLYLTDKFTIGYGVFFFFLIVGLWRKKLSVQARRQAIASTLSTLLMMCATSLADHKNPFFEPWAFCLMGAAFLIVFWNFTCVVKEGDIARQERLDAGIVSKEDRIYNDWARPDPE